MVSRSVYLLVGSAMLSMVVLAGGFPSSATAQAHFAECATRTATNASLILPDTVEIRLDGTRQEGPLQVAIFTPEGHCAGSVHWSGTATTLTAWGTGEETGSSAKALTPNDRLHVRIFNPATTTEYAAPMTPVTVSFQSGASHLTTQRRYVPEGIYVLDTIRIKRRLVSGSK